MKLLKEYSKETVKYVHELMYSQISDLVNL